MSAGHLSFDDLARVADDGHLDEAGSAHLSECDSCRADLMLLRRMDASWNDDFVFGDSAESARWSKQFAESDDAEMTTRQNVLEFARRVNQEDEDARELLEPLLADSTAGFALGIARRGARYRTGGAVRILTATARDALARSPLKALILADEAIEIAELLPDSLYPGGHIELLRGNAWKERANALRVEGRSYEAALDAVDHAERAYRKLPLPEFYLAACDYVRATILHRMDRGDEARSYARRSAETFLAFRDITRYSHARSIEANVLFDASAFAEARPIFEGLLAVAETASDRRTAVGFKINLAATELELGLFEQAVEHLIESLRACDELAFETDAIHARWMLARVPLRAGRPVEAAGAFLKLLEECRIRGMIGTATGVALDLAEAYTLMARPADVVRLCSSLIEDFAARGQLTSAMTAFAFLRDSASSGAVSPAQVQHVRRFIERLQRQPNLLFLPPPR